MNKVTNNAWAQRGDDIEDSDRLEEIKAEYAEKCRRACEGLPDGAIDGGWTAAGMSAYAKQLEVEIERLRAVKSAPIGYITAAELSRCAAGHNAMLRSAKFGPSALDGDVPVFLGPNKNQAPEVTPNREAR